MPANEEPASRRLFQLIWPGALVAQAIYVAAKVAVADRLDDEPQSVDALARATDTRADPLQRVLRVLASVGVFAEEAGERFRHTEMSRTLRTDHPESTRPWAVFLGSPWIWRPWGELERTVRTGEPPFDRIFGEDFYAYMARHPEEAAVYDEAMSSGASMIVDSIVEAFDFSPFRKIVDVGGGEGRLLKGILHANTDARGVLFDMPRVIAKADPALRGGGELADRCELRGGNFFDALPADGDLYVLKGIIHGFADEDAAKLLAICRRSMRPQGKLLIVETVPAGGDETNPQKAFMDLMMLALTPGRERSADELRTLLAQAGLELERVLPTPGPNAIVVASPR